MDRREKDASKLAKKGYKVDFIDNSVHNFYVEFKGPRNSNYDGFKWKICVELPEGYPNKAPVINFENKIYHPNIDQSSGFICVDLLTDEGWSSEYELSYVFESIISSLLLDPNPSSPYNHEAAELYERNRDKYNDKVQDHCFQNATPI